MGVKPSEVDLTKYGYRAWLTRMLVIVYFGGYAALIITAMSLISVQNAILRKARP